MDKIGVGVVGASPLNPGWAVKAHVPAIQILPPWGDDRERRIVLTA
jgi:hypothetical protein